MSVLEIIFTIFGVLVGLFLLWVLIGFLAYLFSLRRGGLAGKLVNKQFMKEIESYKIDYSWWKTVPSKEVEIKAGEETLVGTVLENKGSKKVGICVHGYYGNFQDLNPWAKILFEEGHNVIAPDLRAHGKSSGQKVSMGYFDKDDIVLWINKAIEMFGEDCQIVLFGESMGGATVLMTSELKLPKNVKCVIADLPAFLFLPVANFFSKVFADCDLKKASPIDSIKKSSLPILFLHGLDDKFVPAYMSRDMFDVSNKEICSLYLTKGAGHIKSYAKDPEGYKKVMMSFIEKWLS